MIDTGGGGFSGSSSASAASGIGPITTNTQDRVSKQFINIAGPSALDRESVSNLATDFLNFASREPAQSDWKKWAAAAVAAVVLATLLARRGG